MNDDGRVLWSGRPVPDAAWFEIMPSQLERRTTRAVLYVITACFALFVLFWVGVGVVLWIGELFRDDLGWWDLLWFPLGGLMLAFFAYLPALYVIFPWLSVRNARRRRYVLTDRYAIIVTESRHGEEVDRVHLTRAEAPRLHRVRADGVGDVMFGGYTVDHYTGDGGMTVTAFYDTGFTACPEAERVFELFKEARADLMANGEREDIEEMGRDYQGWLRKQGRL